MEEGINRGSHKLISVPIQPHERIEELDIIRGFALLGILVVNMSFFSYPLMYLEILGRKIWTTSWDRVVIEFIDLLIEGKFYSMFSFLFGLGFIIFIERASKRVKNPNLLFYRRLFILLIIGLIHAFFLWYGDILVTYALLGFLLPLFFNRKPKTILIWVLILFMLAVLPVILSVMAINFGETEYSTEYMQVFMKQMELQVERSFYAYGQGTFSELMAQRVYDTLFTYNYLIFTLPLVFPMFLLGVWAGKMRIFHNIKENLHLIKRIWKWSLIIGSSMSLIKYISGLMAVPNQGSIFDITLMIGKVFGDPGLSIFYISSLVLICQNHIWKKRLAVLANAGRMALSNYLFQSLVCTSIFYSYGLGLYGKVGPGIGLILTIPIFVIQIYLSKWWLSKYKYGPMERIWRSFTYGRVWHY